MIFRSLDDAQIFDFITNAIVVAKQVHKVDMTYDAIATAAEEEAIRKIKKDIDARLESLSIETLLKIKYKCQEMKAGGNTPKPMPNGVDNEPTKINIEPPKRKRGRPPKIRQ